MANFPDPPTPAEPIWTNGQLHDDRNRPLVVVLRSEWQDRGGRLINAEHLDLARINEIAKLHETIASKQAALDASSREIRSQKDKIAMLREMIHDAMVA